MCMRDRHGGSEKDRDGMTKETEERTETKSTRTAFFPSGGAASPTCTTPLSFRLYPLYPLFLSSSLRSSSSSSSSAVVAAAAACFCLLPFPRTSTSNAFLKRSHTSSDDIVNASIIRLNKSF